MSRLFHSLLRTIIIGAVFIFCAMVSLRYFGVRVPGLSQLLDEFDGVGRLSKILS